MECADRTADGKIRKRTADARKEYEKSIDRLKEEQQQAQAKLDELRQSSDDAWQDLKAGIEAAWDQLGNAVNTAVGRFNKIQPDVGQSDDKRDQRD